MGIFEVKHRADGLLARGSDPEHARILQFLNKFVIGRVFRDMNALQAVLATWSQHGGSESIKYSELYLLPERMIISGGFGPGGEFTVGLVEEKSE